MQPFTPFGLDIILINEKCSRDIYDVLIFNKCCKERNIIKWSVELQLTENVEWSGIQLIVFKITKDIMIQWLQYKILHRFLKLIAF